METIQTRWYLTRRPSPSQNIRWGSVGRCPRCREIWVWWWTAATRDPTCTWWPRFYVLSSSCKRANNNHNTLICTRKHVAQNRQWYCSNLYIWRLNDISPKLFHQRSLPLSFQIAILVKSKSRWSIVAPNSFLTSDWRINNGKTLLLFNEI